MKPRARVYQGVSEGIGGATFRHVRWLLAAAALALGSRAHAVPAHGCTFWNARLAAWSTACAEWTVDWNCTITHCAGPFCVSYPGAHFTGYMPDHFFEVTNRAGRSAFATYDAPLMMAQMAAARSNWARIGDVTGLRTTQERPNSGAEYSMWFGRVLPIPYGPAGWSLASAGWTAGEPAATCFRGVSEFAPETWADHVASGDRALAALWAPVATPMCVLGAPVWGCPFAYSLIDFWINRWRAQGSLPVCAIPLPLTWQQAAPWASFNSVNLAAYCMGALGPKYPRTGWTDGDPWMAAQRVAWRTQSLTQDYFLNDIGTGGKWQVIWPPMAAPRCFTPGSLGRPSTADPTSMVARLPGYDRPAGEGVAEWIFAAWNKRDKCLEPWEGAGITVEMLAYQATHIPACTVLNATMPEGL